MKSKRWLVPAIVGVLVIAALALWQPWRDVIPPPVVPAPAAAPQTEVQQLIARMWAIFDTCNDATLDDWELADELGMRAVKLEPLNAEAWAAHANVIATVWVFGFDSTEAQLNRATKAAQRAASLAPDLPAAKLALANCYRWSESTRGEAERLVRELVAQQPNDRRVLRMTGNVLRVAGKYDEAIHYYDRAIALPGSDPIALFGKEQTFLDTGRFAEAEAAIELSFALRPGPAAQLYRVFYPLFIHDDLDAATAALARVPGSFLLQPEGADFACTLWLWRGESDKCLAVLAAFGADEIFGEPKAYLSGLAHRLAGRHAAAEVEWRSALQQTERKLAATPRDVVGLFRKAQLLALLGEKTDAARFLQTAEQLAAPGHRHLDYRRASVLATLGREDEAIALLETVTRDRPTSANSVFEWAGVLHDPIFDPLRGLPRFQAMVARMKQSRITEAPVAGPSNLLAPAPAKSIAILPFANLSPDPENAFFTDGVHEDVITALAKVHDLKVISRTSVMRYKTGDRNLKQIGAELGVATVLEGSVRRSAGKVRVTAQLIDARTDVHLWSETYTVDLTDVFTVQSELAAAITSALKATLSPAEKSLIARRPTDNQAAYDLFLQARIGRSSYRSQIANLEKVIELDPEFTDALALLSIASSFAYWEESDHARADSYRARAVSALAAAERLAPHLPKVREARAAVHYRINLDFPKAWEELRAAEADVPNDSDLLQSLGYTARRLGRWQDALHYFEQSRRLDPFNRSNRFGFQQQTLILLRRLDEARAIAAEAEARLASDRIRGEMRRELEIALIDDGDPAVEPDAGKLASLASGLTADEAWRFQLWMARRQRDWAAADALLAAHATAIFTEPEFRYPAALLRAEIACLTGDTTLAAQQAELAIAHFRDETWIPHQTMMCAQLGIAEAEAWSGRGEDAVRRATEALARAERLDVYDAAQNRPRVGRILIAAGKREEAIALLRKMMSGPSGMTPGQVRRDPFWSRLADDPRFEEILRSAKPL